MTKLYRGQRVYHSVGSERWVMADVKFSSYRKETGIAIVGNQSIPVEVCTHGYIVRKQQGR